MGTQLDDGTTKNTIDPTSKGAMVQNPQVASQAGYTALVSRSDPGAAGTARVWTINGTQNNRLLIADTQYFWDDTFNATAQNTSKYNFQAHTVAMTGAMSGGFLILNNSGLTTINAGCAMRSFRSFPLTGNSEVRVIFSVNFPTANAPVAHTVTEFGLYTAALGGTPAAPLDGIFFRYNAAAELRGVISYNGTETQTAALTQPSTNVNHDFMIIVGTEAVSFWIDREFRAAISLVTDAPALGQPCQMASQPLWMRTYNDGTGPASACKLQISDVFVTMVGPDTGRTWNIAKAGFGHMAYQGQNGGTMGSTGNFGNGALAAATILSNTNVGTGNPVGLGGYSHDLCTLAAGTDGIVTSFANPAGGVNQTPRTLVINGVRISGIVDAAITGGPLAFLYTLAYGHTAVSLATSEAGSFTAGGTTKAPRRIPLGTDGCIVTAPAGTLLSPAGFQVNFTNPVIVAPGEFVAVVARNVGVVASAGSVVHLVGFDGYFE